MLRIFCSRIMPYYAVAIGYETGIYQTWKECEKQVKGFGNAKYKKFVKHQEALDFIQKFSRLLVQRSNQE